MALRRSDTDDTEKMLTHTQSFNPSKIPPHTNTNMMNDGNGTNGNGEISCNDILQNCISAELDEVLTRCSFKVNQRLLLRDLFVSNIASPFLLAPAVVSQAVSGSLLIPTPSLSPNVSSALIAGATANLPPSVTATANSTATNTNTATANTIANSTNINTHNVTNSNAASVGMNVNVSTTTALPTDLIANTSTSTDPVTGSGSSSGSGSGSATVSTTAHAGNSGSNSGSGSGSGSSSTATSASANKLKSNIFNNSVPPRRRPPIPSLSVVIKKDSGSNVGIGDVPHTASSSSSVSAPVPTLLQNAVKVSRILHFSV